MQLSLLRPLAAFLVVFLSLASCRTTHKNGVKDAGPLDSEPSVAAREFLNSHYNFYCEDPKLIRPLLAPRAFRLLKHHFDTYTAKREIGILDCDPWINAQDGAMAQPFHFITLRNDDSEAVVRFDYVFDVGPQQSIPQSVFITFQRSRSGAGWRLSEFIMPNNKSLLDLLERNP